MAKRRLVITAILICLCLFLLPCNVSAVFTSDAVEPISTEQECTLTLLYSCNGQAFSNVPVKLYRVASVTSSAQYTPTSAFGVSGLNLNGIRTSGEWNVIRATLESHILANTIAADISASTDENGYAVIESLQPGLYLLSEMCVEDNGWSYAFDSALISLPGLSENGLWQYQITVTPKPTVLPPIGPDETIQYKILKLWKDEADKTARPQSVDVEIFRDGVSYQLVSLTEDTQWSYSWTAEKDGSDWMITERNIPSGYTVTVEERTTTFILTNTLGSEDPPSEDPKEEKPSPNSPKTGDSSNILFYTILMYVSGCLLILLGIVGKKKQL